jgi:hypothetical protein
MRLQFFACMLLFGLVGCQAMGMRQAALPATGDTAQLAAQRCEPRVKKSAQELEACITRGALWPRLARFQRIADENPGRSGHGNRDTGTPGYAASVAYVASLMRQAGYHVWIQPYVYKKTSVVAAHFRAGGQAYALERDWFVARLSGAGSVTAAVVAPHGSVTGCSAGDFAGFPKGDVALLQRGECDFDAQVANAEAAGAAAVVLYDARQSAYPARLVAEARIPVIGAASSQVGAALLGRARTEKPAIAHIDVDVTQKTDIDYNVVADSRFGDPNHVVVIDAHLDSIYGAGMLDNASGSTSILDVALNLANTPTRNHLRYIWFGGEEIGLLGSHFYTTHLSKTQLGQIVFDVDVDVTATPNFDFMIANPANATKVKHFPPNVVPQSKIGNDYFTEYFRQSNVPVRSAWFGNDGTDSLEFSLLGVPNSGILTMQDCCKHRWETAIWGGFRGNYEGKIPSHNGGCVDYPHRWCDNLDNNDPLVLELVSKGVGYVTYELANRRHFPSR